MNKKNVRKVLSDIYFDVKNPGSFGGVNKLYVEAKKVLPELELSTVERFLSGENAYTLHKPVVHKFKRNKIIVSRINEQFEADLVDMINFSRANKGFKYLLVIIDCFSKVLYVFPLKNKTHVSVVKSFKKLFEDVKPEKLRTDRGLEFDNKQMRKFLEDNDVTFFTSNDTKIKCAIVERVNRTLKSKMFRYFTQNNTRKYIDILPDLVSSYNNSYHRSIKMAPNNVNKENENQVFKNLYGAESVKELLFRDGSDFHRKSEIKPDDKVRVKLNINPTLHKSHYPLWSDKVYEVSKVTNKPVAKNYQLNFESEKQRQSFYPKEIQKIDANVVFRIEKVIKKRKRNGIEELFVKFIDYPSKFNQWIRKDQIVIPK